MCECDVRSGSLEWNRAIAPHLFDDHVATGAAAVPHCSSSVSGHLAVLRGGTGAAIVAIAIVRPRSTTVHLSSVVRGPCTATEISPSKCQPCVIDRPFALRHRRLC